MQIDLRQPHTWIPAQVRDLLDKYSPRGRRVGIGLALAALLIALFAILAISYLVLLLLRPAPGVFPQNVLSRLSADYRPWLNPPLIDLPPIDPQVAAAINRDAAGRFGGGGPAPFVDLGALDAQALATATASPTVSHTPSATPVVTPTATASPTQGATVAATASATPAILAVSSPVPATTPTLQDSAPTAVSSPTRAPSATASATATPTRTATNLPAPSATPTR
ncbi:MAG: hypothetical protein HC822_18265, partial [Oscillochloris sp.]|nr:hypothetical protein [Oscillochloris sp.]